MNFRSAQQNSQTHPIAIYNAFVLRLSLRRLLIFLSPRPPLADKNSH